MNTISGTSVFDGRDMELEFNEEGIHDVREPQGPTSSESVEACGRRFISPGFVDIQVNGYRGSDYSSEGFSEDDLHAIHGHLAEAGTTQHVPTIVTSPRDRLLRNLCVLAEVLDRDPLMQAAIPGIHIEGPYISSEDGPRGAHDAAYVRDPDYGEYREWQQASGNRIRIVTLAPERHGAIEFIEKLAADGVCVGIGHSAADPDTIRRAVRAGARLSTHLGNGSHPEIPRLNNYIWEQLAQDDLWASIICDGYHLPDSVVKVFQRAKGVSGVILVSDAALLGGRNSGIYKWGQIEVEVFPDGHLGLPGTSLLAGAAHLLDWDIAQCHRFTSLPLGAVIKLCTVNPARMLGIEDAITTEFSVGQPANLTVFRYSGAEHRLQIEETWCGGKEIYAVSQ